MSYVRDNGLARARRRRERRSIAILALCGLLVLGSIIFAATFMSTSTKKNPCKGAASVQADPRSLFVLDVYNSGGPKGAANDAATALRTHNFQVGIIGNDPYRKKVTGAGEIRFGPAGADRAKRYVAPLIPGATLVEDGRDGTSVDAVIGPQFPTITPGQTKPTDAATPGCS